MYCLPTQEGQKNGGRHLRGIYLDWWYFLGFFWPFLPHCGLKWKRLAVQMDFFKLGNFWKLAQSEGSKLKFWTFWDLQNCAILNITKLWKEFICTKCVIRTYNFGPIWSLEIAHFLKRTLETSWVFYFLIFLFHSVSSI